ncbi:MAG: CapA family protein [Acidobacteriota bacterium]|nr:CapA family protein [Acidobacteriota bacterium]
MNRRQFLRSGAAAGVVALVGGPSLIRAADGGVLLGFVGDLLTDRDDPDEAYAPVRDLLAAPDVLFGNLEGPYSDNPRSVPSAGLALVPPARNLDVLSRVGFDVLSLANNHILDGGREAMLENRQRLHEQGVSTCGAGGSLEEARAPAILEAGGVKVAYLAYASVFPRGYEARGSLAGLAPLRAHNFYQDLIDDAYTPGADPRVSTVPDKADHDNLAADIAAAKEQADLVVASFHWGDHFKAHHLTDHELRTARLCIDLGVDIVVGHHQHVLRGMEWYRDRPVFYGLGHFVFDVRLDRWPEEMVAAMPVLDDDADYYGVAPRRGWPLMPLHPEARMTALGYVRLAEGTPSEFGFVPCRLNPEGAVRAVDPESPEGREVVDYVDHGCASQNLNGRVDRTGYVDVGGHRGVRILPAEERAGDP